MARPKGGPHWEVLDWAARQQGEFSIGDAYKVWQDAGGGGTYQNFSSTFNKWVSKYDPNSPVERYRDQGKYGLSDKRPIVITKAGRQAAGRKAMYRWGLDHPLREPPEQTEPLDGEVGDVGSSDASDAIGDALDRMESAMGREALKSALARWKNMSDLHHAVEDIRKTVPARLRADAVHVAAQAIMAKGRPVSKSDVRDAEQDVRGGLPTKSGPSASDIEIDDDELEGEWEIDSATDPEVEPPEMELGDDDIEMEPEPEPAPMQPEPKAPEPSRPPEKVSKFIQEPTKKKQQQPSGPPQKQWDPFSKVIRKPKKP
jgi:hypothetical protein